jgi:bacteriorhodopsin
MQKRRWADLSAFQRTCVIIGAMIQFSLLVAGLWDLAHRTRDEVRGDRRLWAGFMFVNWIGPIAYFTYGRKNPIWNWGSCGEEEEDVEEIGQVALD